MKRKAKSFSFPSHIKKLAAAILAAVVMSSSFSGCVAQRERTDTFQIGIALYSQDDTFISTVVQYIERFAQEKEAGGEVKINMSFMDGRSNQTVQLEQVDRFLEKGCDAICVNIVDRTAAAVLVDKAQSADIPIIFFNRQPVEEDIQRWDKAYYVGAKAEDSGALQGQLVRGAWWSDRKQVDKNGDGIMQYVMLEGEPGHQDALLRTTYSIDTLTSAGIRVEKLASDTAEWNRGQAAALMVSWMERFGDCIEVVFSNNDDMALGAIDAMVSRGMNVQDMPVVVGVDLTPPAIEAMREGTLYGTVRNPAKEIAESMLELSMALKSGSTGNKIELEDGHYIWLPYEIVDNSNLSRFTG